MIMTRNTAEFWWNILKNKDKFVCPPDVAFYKKNNTYDKWESVLWSEVMTERKTKQENILLNIKKNKEETKPCFIWVFYNNTWLFGGWYIYIKTLKNDYPLNFRINKSDIINKIMNLIPCNILGLDFYQWAEKFEQIHHKECFGRKKQGLIKAHCKIEYNNIVDVYL